MFAACTINIIIIIIIIVVIIITFISIIITMMQSLSLILNTLGTHTSLVR